MKKLFYLISILMLPFIFHGCQQEENLLQEESNVEDSAYQARSVNSMLTYNPFDHAAHFPGVQLYHDDENPIDILSVCYVDSIEEYYDYGGIMIEFEYVRTDRGVKYHHYIVGESRDYGSVNDMNGFGPDQYLCSGVYGFYTYFSHFSYDEEGNPKSFFIIFPETNVYVSDIDYRLFTVGHTYEFTNMTPSGNRSSVVYYTHTGEKTQQGGGPGPSMPNEDVIKINYVGKPPFGTDEDLISFTFKNAEHSTVEYEYQDIYYADAAYGLNDKTSWNYFGSRENASMCDTWYVEYDYQLVYSYYLNSRLESNKRYYFKVVSNEGGPDSNIVSYKHEKKPSDEYDDNDGSGILMRTISVSCELPDEDNSAYTIASYSAGGKVTGSFPLLPAGFGHYSGSFSVAAEFSGSVSVELKAWNRTYKGSASFFSGGHQSLNIKLSPSW